MRWMIVAITSLSLYAGAAQNMKKLEIQGHRGARWARPENTLPAFTYALDAGVDTLEMDTLLTKDNQVVVMHDPHLNPEICLGPNGKPISGKMAVRSLTLKELKTYDCGSLISPRFKQQVPVPGTRIPTLREVFEMVAKHPNGKKVLFNIETKSAPGEPELYPEPDRFVRELLSLFKEFGVTDRVTLQSFDYRTLEAARTQLKSLSLAVLIEERPKPSLVELAKRYDAGIVSPHYQWLTAEDIKALHNAGIRVIPWTLNDPKDWEKFISLGVDGIITDNPKELINRVRRAP